MTSANARVLLRSTRMAPNCGTEMVKVDYIKAAIFNLHVQIKIVRQYQWSTIAQKNNRSIGHAEPGKTAVSRYVCEPQGSARP